MWLDGYAVTGAFPSGRWSLVWLPLRLKIMSALHADAGGQPVDFAQLAALTPAGRRAFRRHVNYLREIVEGLDTN